MRTMNVLIRFADHKDIETIKRFQIAMALETENIELDENTVEKGVSAIFKKKAHGRYVVTEIDGRVVASLLLLDEWSDWRNGVVWWIHSVYVDPAFRGQKIFPRMYHYIQASAEADPSIRGLRLYVEKHNDRAQHVYSKIGMSKDRYDMYEWMKSF